MNSKADLKNSDASANGHAGHSHAHGHEGHANCPSQGADANRLLLCAAITGVFMIAEVIGGLVSGSLALLADAGHMVTDFGALIGAYIGVRLGGKRAATYIALVSGLSLILIAVWIVKEGIERLSNPSAVLGGPMLIVAILGLIVNIVVFLILIRGNRENLNMRGAILHVAADMLGSLAAIIAAVIILTTNYYPADPILSGVVAIIIVISAIPLIRDSLKALRR